MFHYNECSIAERSHHTRLIYNKLYQQWNIFRYDKGKHPNITNQCRLCGQVDSMQHLITSCKEGGVARIWPEAKHALDTIRSEMGDNRYLDTIIDTIKHLLKLPDATHIWTATWQPSQTQYLQEQLQLAFNFNNLSSLEVSIIQSTLLRISAVLIEYTKEIVSDRIHRLRELDKNIKDPLRNPKERRDTGSILIKVRKIQSRVRITRKQKTKLSTLQQNDLKLAKTIKKLKNLKDNNSLCMAMQSAPTKVCEKSRLRGTIAL